MSIEINPSIAGNRPDPFREERDLDRMEEQLRRSAPAYRRLVEASPDGIATMDPDGRVTYASPRIHELLNVAMSVNLRGQSVLEWIAPEQQAEAKSRIQQLLATKEPTGIQKYRLLRPDGSAFPGEMSAAPLLNGQGEVTGLVSFWRDVTARSRGEHLICEAPELKERCETEQRFRQVTENIESVFWMTNVELDRMVYVSPAYERIWGSSTASLYARPTSFLDSLHPEDRARVLAHFQEKRLATPTKFEVEYRIVRPDGDVRWIRDRAFPIKNPAGQVELVVGIADDITERKNLENEVALRGQQLKSFFRGTTAGLAMLDKEMRYLQINDTLAEINGLPAQAHLGKTLREVLPKLASTIEPLFQKVLLTGEPIMNIEVSGETSSQPGVQRHWIQSIFPIHGTNGETQGAGAIIVEITDRKRLEEQYRQAQKMEAVGRLAGGVAHDFNNSLAVIRLNAEFLLMNQEGLNSRTIEGLQQIGAATAHASNLTRQLLAFSRKQVMRSEDLDLNEVIANVSKMLRRTIGEDIELQCIFATRLPLIQADVGMLEQVLVNLVVNSRDAMPNGGRLLLRTEAVQIQDQYARINPEARAGDFICLQVTDSGTGIAAAHLSHLFEPFFTTKAQGKGTGLGLATVHGIVKQHHGWVEVVTQEGAGTTFKVFLPSISSSSAKPAPEPAPILRGGTETILLAEDDDAVRSATARVLETYGYKVLQASCAQEALERAKTPGVEVDLLLSDVVMPHGMTGRELADRLRAERAGLKVMLMSGYGADILSKDPGYFKRTNARFLQKPFTMEMLLESLRDYLGR